MKITIDDKICLKHGLTPNEVMLALAIRTGEIEEDISNMVARGILVDKGEYLVTQRWSDVLDEILCDSQSSIEKSDEELLNLAQRMRECFPQGKMPGTPYYYRCNNSEVIKKLKKFFIQYGNYPDDDIVDACKRFVASFRGNYKYLPLVKYFISKLKDQEDEDGTIHKVEYSPLADYLENKE
jgi:hypothetical protein